MSHDRPVHAADGRVHTHSQIDCDAAVLDKASQAATRPSRRKHHLVDRLTDRFASKTRYWWVLLVVGFTWIAIAFAIPRFAYATVATIAILVGACCFGGSGR
jgi:hypothetical protein